MGWEGEGAKWAAPIWVLHSRQRRPLFQDDELRRGDCAPRSFIQSPTSRDIAEIGKVYRVIGKARIYDFLIRVNQRYQR